MSPTQQGRNEQESTDRESANLSGNKAKRVRPRNAQGRTNTDTTGSTPSHQRPIYSAIDLGTNNCRLLVAKPTYTGFRIIDAFSRVVKLGEGLNEYGELSQGAMDRTIEALNICQEKLIKRRVTHMRHVATAACRVAANADHFVERVKAETGLGLEIITTEEEARLAVAGCQTLITPNHRYALVFDIGGGSTELIWVRVRGRGRTSIIGWTSVPWGVVNLTEKFMDGKHEASADDYQRMIDTVSVVLKPFMEQYDIEETVRRRRVQFLGTSGTVTTLASLHFDLPRYNRNKIDGAWVSPNSIRDLARMVGNMSHKELILQPCIGPDRADLVIAGCAILDAIMDVDGLRSLRVADRGIREGILRSLMKDHAREQHNKNRQRAQTKKAQTTRGQGHKS